MVDHDGMQMLMQVSVERDGLAQEARTLKIFQSRADEKEMEIETLKTEMARVIAEGQEILEEEKRKRTVSERELADLREAVTASARACDLMRQEKEQEKAQRVAGMEADSREGRRKEEEIQELKARLKESEITLQEGNSLRSLMAERESLLDEVRHLQARSVEMRQEDEQRDLDWKRKSMELSEELRRHHAGARASFEARIEQLSNELEAALAGISTLGTALEDRQNAEVEELEASLAQARFLMAAKEGHLRRVEDELVAARGEGVAALVNAQRDVDAARQDAAALSDELAAMAQQLCAVELEMENLRAAEASAQGELATARTQLGEAKREKEQRDVDVTQLQGAYEIAQRHAQQEGERHALEIQHVRSVLASAEQQLWEFELRIEAFEKAEGQARSRDRAAEVAVKGSMEMKVELEAAQEEMRGMGDELQRYRGKVVRLIDQVL